MGKICGKFSVYFDGKFWVGLFERVENGKLSVSKVTFGAEPKDCEVSDLVSRHYFDLRFSPTVSAVLKETKVNPKRMQREVKKQLSDRGIGTKSQLAMKLLQEQNKIERKEKSREEKIAEKQRIFELKQQKKKDKHRGH